MWLQLGSDMVTPFLFLSSQLFSSVGYIYPHWLLFFAILLALQSLKLLISAALLFSSGFSLFFAMLPCLQSPKLYISATHLCSSLFVRFPNLQKVSHMITQPNLLILPPKFMSCTMVPLSNVGYNRTSQVFWPLMQNLDNGLHVIRSHVVHLLQLDSIHIILRPLMIAIIPEERRPPPGNKQGGKRDACY